MTTEERLAVVETELRGLKDWVAANDAKLDQIIAATHMGKGAWLLLVKVGVCLTAVVAAAAGVLTLIEKLITLLKH